MPLILEKFKFRGPLTDLIQVQEGLGLTIGSYRIMFLFSSTILIYRMFSVILNKSQVSTSFMNDSELQRKNIVILAVSIITIYESDGVFSHLFSFRFFSPRLCCRQFKFDDEVARDPFIKPNQKLIVHIIFRLNL